MIDVSCFCMGVRQTEKSVKIQLSTWSVMFPGNLIELLLGHTTRFSSLRLRCLSIWFMPSVSLFSNRELTTKLTNFVLSHNFMCQFLWIKGCIILIGHHGKNKQTNNYCLYVTLKHMFLTVCLQVDAHSKPLHLSY